MSATAIQNPVEGKWEEISREHGAEFSGHRVRVFLLLDDASIPHRKPLTRGMFAGYFPNLTLEDFKIAEYQGDELL